MAKDNVVQIRMSEEEYDAIQKAADREDRTISHWGRRALLTMASRGGKGSGPLVAKFERAEEGDAEVFERGPGQKVAAGGVHPEQEKVAGFVPPKNGVAEPLNGGKPAAELAGPATPIQEVAAPRDWAKFLAGCDEMEPEEAKRSITEALGEVRVPPAFWRTTRAKQVVWLKANA